MSFIAFTRHSVSFTCTITLDADIEEFLSVLGPTNPHLLCRKCVCAQVAYEGRAGCVREGGSSSTFGTFPLNRNGYKSHRFINRLAPYEVPNILLPTDRLDTVGVWGSNPHASTNVFNNLAAQTYFLVEPYQLTVGVQYRSQPLRFDTLIKYREVLSLFTADSEVSSWL